MSRSTLYDQDFLLWTQQQIELLKTGHWAALLEDTPSLQRLLHDSAWIQKYYQRAHRDAVPETQMPVDVFPANCPCRVEQSFDPDFG